MADKPPILVTLGDPNGVGPAICARAWNLPSMRRLGLAFVGSSDILERALRREGIEAEPTAWNPGSPLPRAGVPVWEPPGLPSAELHPGENRRDAGAQALASVDAAVSECLAGTARAMVTAPLSKEAVSMTSPGFSGHTGRIASLCGASSHCLALNHGKLWAAFTTTHVALRDVPALITTENVSRTGRLLHAALVGSGVAAPRVGVAGLNPHAGEHGLFGDEEATAVEPAIAVLRSEGIDASGPWPSDVAFPLLKAGRLDGVVCLYHDQGHPVMKTLGFDLRRNRLRGVNVTLGLPIVRTSPDHGTGFDIAWKERADEGSLVDALRLADRLARPSRTR
jgi:4-hydroxythreonine-4-phosphate dehydrogenase